MSSRRPTLGFPSVKNAVLGLTETGMTTNEIASAIGSTPEAVRVTRYKAQKAAAVEAVSIKLDGEVLSSVRLAAAARKISGPQLMRRLIETAVRDGLVDAILDDAPEPPAPHMRSQPATSSQRQREKA